MESHDSHDIVDFDETIPVTDNRPSLVLPLLVRAQVGGAAGAPTPALAPLAEPPRASPGYPGLEPSARAGAPASTPPDRASAPSALIAPVVAMPPSRPGFVPPSSSEAVPPSIPRPPPSSRNASGPPSSSPRPSPAPVVTPLDPFPRSPLLTEPPPGSTARPSAVAWSASWLLASFSLRWASPGRSCARSSMLRPAHRRHPRTRRRRRSRRPRHRHHLHLRLQRRPRRLPSIQAR